MYTALMESTRAAKHADPSASEGRGARRERGRSESPPADVFVSREREMGILVAGLEDAVSGRGHLFMVAGEPGIGKTRLADEFAARAKARGLPVLWGRCWEAGGAPAYWPWVHSLRSCLREPDPELLLAQLGSGASHVAQIIPELRELFPALPAPPSLDPEAARFCLFEAVTQFLRNVASACPVVVILDDLHAADTPSLLLLRFLAGELAEAHILVLGTFRDTELRPDHPLAATLAELARQPVTRSLLLGGLGKLGVARFLEATTRRTPLESLVATVHAVTEGNPLFVGEVVRLLAHEGRLEHPEDIPSWKLSIPQSIKQVIGRRLSHLSEAGRRTLTVASVLGREFNPEILQPVSALSGDQLLDVLDEAVSAGVIAEVPSASGHVRFRHALIRESLYHDLSPTRRVRLHRRVGEALETLYATNLDPHLDELAYHFIEAAPTGEVEKAIFYARAAADRAMTQLAYEEAGRLYKMALHALDLKESSDNVVRCELRLALGDAQARAGDSPAARTTFLGAADIAKESRLPAQLAQAALGYGGRFVWEAGRGDRHLVPLLQDALRALGEEESVLRVKLMARLAGGPLRDETIREPRAALSWEAVEMARRLGDPGTLAYVLDGRYAAIWWPDNLADRLATATELIGVAEQARDLERAHQGYHYRCLARLELGDVPGVYSDVEAQARLAEKLRQPAQQWYVTTVRAMLATFEGRFAEAEELIPRAYTLSQRAQAWMAVVYRTLQLYALRREQARLEEIEEDITRVARDFPTYPVLRCVLAHAYMEMGRQKEAREVFEALASDQFAMLPFDDEWIFGVSLLADVAECLEDVPRIRTLYTLLLPYAERNALSNPDICIGSVSRNLGILAARMCQWQEAVCHFEAALAMNAKNGARPWLARTQRDYAHMLLARDDPGDRERAAELLARALETCRALGMAALTPKVMSLLELTRAEATAAQMEKVVPIRPRRETQLPSRPNLFRREGEYWSIAFEGVMFRLKDAKGLRHLARLLGEPGREFHVLDLVAADRRADSAADEIGERDRSFALGDAGEILDPEAKAAYRRRLADLDEELKEAADWGDSARVARAEEEKDFLIQQLANAVGLGGRDRRAASAAERARVNVTRAIKDALVRIRQHSSDLSRHLDTTVSTGTFCSYTPDPRSPISWRT